MRNRLLIITDNARARWLSRFNRQIKNNSSEVSVLTLGITPEYFLRRNPKKIEILKSFSFVNIDEISKKAQELVANFYINFIFKLPQEVPSNLFFYKGINLWWFLEISEKCPVRNRIIRRLFYLELVKHVIEKGQFQKFYLDLDDCFVAQCLLEAKPNEVQNLNIFVWPKLLFHLSPIPFLFRYFKNCFGVALLLLLRSISLKLNEVKGIKPPREKGLYFFTNYPFWWNKPFQDKAGEKFFVSFPESLMPTHKIFYATWLFSLNPVEIFLRSSFLRSLFIGKNMLLMESFLGAKDKVEILSLGFLKWMLAVRNYFKKHFEYNYGIFSIKKFVYYEIYRSLSHVELFNDYLIEHAFENFSNQYHPEALIYRVEFQPFEKAILMGINKRYKVIAFQHSTLSRNRISHFFARDEISFHLDPKNINMAMPLPDIIFSTGEYFKDIMQEAGFPGERIFICGPLRYQTLLNYLRQPKQKEEIKKQMGFSNSEPIFLVATSWIKEETLALLSILLEATDSIGDKLYFIFRSHPHIKFDRDISKILKSAKPNFRYSFLDNQFPLYDTVYICEGLIQALNTLGYEAMAMGRVPVIYENRHIFNFNSSEELRVSVPVVSSADELRRAIHSILEENKRLDCLPIRYSDIMKKFFYDLDTDPKIRFKELLQRQGLLG